MALNFSSYINGIFYIWSVSNGALNLSGALRTVSYIPNLIIYLLFRNVLITEYFYIASVVLVCFLSFFWFLRSFFKHNSYLVDLIISLFFAINPVFLGDESKVGLVLGIAMLPLLLVTLKHFFKTKDATGSYNLGYFFIAVLALDISFIHPFIFVINGVIVFCFWLYEKYLRRDSVHFYREVLKETGIFIGINAFIFCILFSAGTLDKTAIVNTLNPTAATDALLDYANTGGLVNSFAMSRYVLLDYNFYNNASENLYFAAAFALYALAIAGCFIFMREKNFDRRVFLFMFLGCLTVQLFSTDNLLWVNYFLNFINSTPGGWAFRSPLKWQLYQPFFLFGLLALWPSFFSRNNRWYLYACLMLIFVTLNFYLVGGIYENLLLPKSVDALSGFDALLSGKQSEFLVVNFNGCTSYQQELNEIVLSNNVEEKQATPSQLTTIDIRSFDYIASCQPLTLPGFKLQIALESPQFFIYENLAPVPTISTADAMYGIDASANIQAAANLVGSYYKTSFSFVIPDPENNLTPIDYIQGLFTNLNISQIRTAGEIVATTSSADFYGKTSELERISGTNTYRTFPVVLSSTTEFTFETSAYNFSNLITNGSFESGTWQPRVYDCYNYDSDPIISMSLSSDASAGHQSLQLSAERHNACTSIKVPVPQGDLLFSFDYESPNDAPASYAITFNNPATTTIAGLLPTGDASWHTFSQQITVPQGATSLLLYIYARQSNEKTINIVRYDNFRLFEVPNLTGDFYLISTPTTSPVVIPSKTQFEQVNPTKTLVQIMEAKTPFFLELKESYDPNWQLELNNGSVEGWLNSWQPFVRPTAVPAEYHYELDGFLNAWYVDPTALCDLPNGGLAQGCTKNPDGSYNIQMEIEFTPQRWFYLGLLISGITLVGCLGYLGYEGVKRFRAKRI